MKGVEAGKGTKAEVNEHSASIVEHRMMKSLRSVSLQIGRRPYSKFDVGRSMFDVQSLMAM